MTKPAYLDSSVVIDLCFWDKKARQRVEEVLKNYSSSNVTPYVLFEIGRGFLSYLITLHNKTVLFSDMADVIAYARSLYMRPYRSSAVLNAYEMFLRHGSSDELGLNSNQQLELFKGDIQRRIRRGWRKASQLTAKSVNAPKCRPNIPAPRVEISGCIAHDLPTRECGDLTNCGIRDYIYSNSDQLRTGASVLSKIDNELFQRAKSLRQLLKLPRTNFRKRDCWQLGDLLIVHEIPSNAVIVTKNSKHFAPIGKQFGREIASV